VVYPGIRYVLENISHNKNYIQALRDLEQEMLQGDSDDVYRSAFYRLRFGFDLSDSSIRHLVDEAYDELVERLEIARGPWDYCFTNVIGMRGVMSAFEFLKDFRDETQGFLDWKEFAEWFVEGVNKVIDQEWFVAWEKLQENPRLERQRHFLTHVVYHPAGNIVNYRVRKVPRALGTLLALLILKEGSNEPAEREKAWGDQAAPGGQDTLTINNLRGPLGKGLGDQFRTEYNQLELTKEQRDVMVRESSEAAVTEYISDLRSYLNG
jgi:hypothetical protein